MHASRLFSKMLFVCGTMVLAIPMWAQTARAQAEAVNALVSEAVSAPSDDVAPVPSADADTTATNQVAPLPRPAELEPQINFWRRVYSEIDTHHGFIHDARHLSVVYATIEEPHGRTRRATKRMLSEQKRVYSNILTTLAHGKRTDLTAQEAAVLALWPQDVTNSQLAQAALNVRFQSGQSDRFLAGIVRSRTWMPHIISTFAAAGLPQELSALPHVESSFDMRAFSNAKAAGIFQFTSATARQYMHITPVVDERYDPLLATNAAARLLASNYRRTGEWPLAITSYNHGVDGVVRAMRRMHTKELTTLIANYHTRRFGFASRNFYTELLAAWDVSSHAEKYFGTLPAGDGGTYASAKTDAFYHAGSLAKALGVDLAILRANNPALRPAVWSGQQLVPVGYTLRIPQPAGIAMNDLSARMTAIPDSERYDSSAGLRMASLHRKDNTVQSASAVNTSPGAAVPGVWRPEGYTPVPAEIGK